jgi:tetratricopeptide (TPR) repeat protein
LTDLPRTAAPEKSGKWLKAVIIAAGGLIVAAGLGAAFIFVGLPMIRYNGAAELERDGKYEEASEAFDEIGDYRDAPERARGAIYKYAEAMLKDGEYDAAAERFGSVRGYEDARERVSEAKYLAADGMEQDGEYESAAAAFAKLGDYSDAPERARGAIYKYADELAAAGEYDKALTQFSLVRDYSDAGARIDKIIYTKAVAFADAGDYAAAAALLEEIADFPGAAEKLEEYRAILAPPPAPEIDDGNTYGDTFVDTDGIWTIDTETVDIWLRDAFNFTVITIYWENGGSTVFGGYGWNRRILSRNGETRDTGFDFDLIGTTLFMDPTTADVHYMFYYGGWGTYIYADGGTEDFTWNAYLPSSDMLAYEEWRFGIE